MKKIILIGIISLILTGCGSSNVGDIYDDVNKADEIVNNKILDNKGCVGVELDYNIAVGSTDFDDNVKLCKEGIKEFKEIIPTIDKKMKKIDNSDLKENWKNVKENYDKEISNIEKSLEIFLAWGDYKKCHNAKMTTEKEILKCLEPMFDLKYDEIDKVFKEWAPLTAEESKLWNELQKYSYGSDKRDEINKKLDKARKTKNEYEEKNKIYDNGNRIILENLIANILKLDSNYEEDENIVRYSMEKIDFSSFSHNVESTCIEEKNEKCIQN